jgi:hypothetical protein
MIQFHPNNPMRAVTWRWERARLMREGKSRTVGRRSADPVVKAAYRFQMGLSKCKDDVDRYDLMEEYPALYGAYLIYQRGDDADRHPLRFAIEARLLAGQADYDIAARLGMSPDVIDMYEALFFNVKEKLANTDYIMTCVISPSVHAGLTDRDYDLLWKLFGFIYGPVVLDSFIHTTTRSYRPESASEVDAALAEDTRSSLQRRVAVVARTYTVNAFSQSELLNIYTRLLEMEKEMGGQKNKDLIMQNVQVMVEALPFRPGSKPGEQPALLSQYDSGGVELRTDELMSISSGTDITTRSEIENLTFPQLEMKTDAKPTK